MALPPDNQLLACLPVRDLSELAAHFRVVELRTGSVLARPRDKIRTVYFPLSGIVSFVALTGSAGGIQTAIVGKDGVVGATQALDDRISLNGINVQVGGSAITIDRDPLREAIRNGNAIQQVFAAYEEFFVSDAQQTAACNAVHHVDARMARWLLRMTKLAGDDLLLTQSELAEMLGVRRPSVSVEANRLQSAGAISYVRGRIHIENRKILTGFACECHDIAEENYKAVFEAMAGK